MVVTGRQYLVHNNNESPENFILGPFSPRVHRAGDQGTGDKMKIWTFRPALTAVLWEDNTLHRTGFKADFIDNGESANAERSGQSRCVCTSLVVFYILKYVNRTILKIEENGP